jgi:hypothetical protein
LRRRRLEQSGQPRDVRADADAVGIARRDESSLRRPADRHAAGRVALGTRVHDADVVCITLCDLAQPRFAEFYGYEFPIVDRK